MRIARIGNRVENLLARFSFPPRSHPLPIDVLLLVLLGAALHAVWNAIVKAGSDKSLDAAMIALGAGATSAAGVRLVRLA